MKRKLRSFLRSWMLSSVIAFCIIFAVYGITKAYEGIRLIGFGEHRRAIEFTDNGIKFFDKNIEF